MSKSYNIISMAGAVLLLAGAVLQITRWELAPYLYTLGAVMFGYVQVMGNRYDGRNFIINWRAGCNGSNRCCKAGTDESRKI